MRPGRAGARRRQALAASALSAALLGACTVSPVRCDPSDASFGLSLLCQGEYTARQQALQEEVAEAGRRGAALETDRAAIETDRIAMAEVLATLDERARAASARVDVLRQEGGVSEARLTTIEKRIASVETDIASLESEREAIEAGRSDPEVAARIESLRAEELELETLLQDLES